MNVKKTFALALNGVGCSMLGLALICELEMSSNIQNALTLVCAWVYMMSIGVIIKIIKT